MFEAESGVIGIVLSENGDGYEDEVERRAKALDRLPEVILDLARAKKKEQEMWKRFMDKDQENGLKAWEKWNCVQSHDPSVNRTNQSNICSMYSMLDPDSAAAQNFRQKFGHCLDADSAWDTENSESVQSKLEKLSERWTQRYDGDTSGCPMQ